MNLVQHMFLTENIFLNDTDPNIKNRIRIGFDLWHIYVAPENKKVSLKICHRMQKLNCAELRSAPRKKIRLLKIRIPIWIHQHCLQIRQYRYLSPVLL
jgi:hypothetical protein